MLKENTITVKKYRERNSFDTDVKGKGKFAEDDFIKYFYKNPKNSDKKLYDVTLKCSNQLQFITLKHN